MTRVCLQLTFFNDTATTEIYTLSLHDALPISEAASAVSLSDGGSRVLPDRRRRRDSRPLRLHSLRRRRDRKSTRLNSSHANNSYAGFCLQKKNSMNSRSSLASSFPPAHSSYSI